MDYVLFDARHEVPANAGALCTGFDFATKQVAKSPLWEQAVADANCRLYVTGLTPALTEFIAAYTRQTLVESLNLAGAGWGDWADAGRQLVLLHHDRESGAYWEQYV